MKRFISTFLIIVMFLLYVPVATYAQRDITTEEILAQELKDLGLFRGVSDTDFDLDRPPSRVEALVMLIRVLGKESDVTSGVWRHPFTDVPGWADKYVGYAYSNGLTNGQSPTEFGVGDANAAMYVTFVLRALGYSDTNGKDFVWNDPFTLAREISLLSDAVNINEFWRADVVLISHAALSAYINGSEQTLAQKLISAGVFTYDKFISVYNAYQKNTPPAPENKELTAEEVYAKCSPAVFYIENYNASDEVISSGSGFFIDNNGTAVTNYHVIEGAHRALIQLSDTSQIYEVLGVYDYSIENDWAVIKIDCTGNSYLNIGDTSTVIGASTVYAIGSPLGLQNTISQGIISNTSRVGSSGVSYIQTTAAISHGSSGGALLNKYGEVIGITSAGYSDGQNLNLAIPMTYINGYSSGNLVSLSDLNRTNYNPYAPTDDSKKQATWNILKDFVLNNCQDYNETMGYEFLIDIERDDGLDTYTIWYDPVDNVIVVSVSMATYGSYICSYYFSIELDKETTFAMFAYDIYTEYAGYVDESTGYAQFPCAHFNKDYDIQFYEYEGDTLDMDQNIAKLLHNDGLEFVNLIFETYFPGLGYTAQDLGYTTYSEF